MFVVVSVLLLCLDDYSMVVRKKQFGRSQAVLARVLEVNGFLVRINILLVCVVRMRESVQDGRVHGDHDRDTRR